MCRRSRLRHSCGGNVMDVCRRTSTTPSSRQFVSLTADQSSEVICAGTLDSFEIFVWSMKTGRLLDILGGHEGLVHSLMFSPTNGKQLACSTLDGQIHFWDPIDSLLMYTIEGRRDIPGGQLATDRRAVANSSSGKCFTTLCYSADGSYILAGGSNKYICLYDVAEQRGPFKELRSMVVVGPQKLFQR